MELKFMRYVPSVLINIRAGMEIYNDINRELYTLFKVLKKFSAIGIHKSVINTADTDITISSTLPIIAFIDAIA